MDCSRNGVRIVRTGEFGESARIHGGDVPVGRRGRARPTCPTVAKGRRQEVSRAASLARAGTRGGPNFARPAFAGDRKQRGKIPDSMKEIDCVREKRRCIVAQIHSCGGKPPIVFESIGWSRRDREVMRLATRNDPGEADRHRRVLRTWLGPPTHDGDASFAGVGSGGRRASTRVRAILRVVPHEMHAMRVGFMSRRIRGSTIDDGSPSEWW